MKRRKLIFKILIFAVVLCLNLNLVVAFADPDTSSTASGSTSSTSSSSTGTSSGSGTGSGSSGETDNTEQEEPEDINYELVASNRNLELYFDSTLCYIKVVDKNTGNEWASSPDYSHTLSGGTGTKNNVGSLITYSYYDSSDNTVNKNIRAQSVNNGNFKVNEIENGLKIIFTTTEQFSIPVEIKLEDDSISASIVVNEITEPEDSENRIAQISLMPYFGAVGPAEEGYAVVPDGSGAIIEFNQTGTNAYTYSQRIYGRDFGQEIKSQSSVTQDARLPVFGINRNGAGMIAVINESPAAANVNCNIIGENYRVNNAYFSYVHRTYDTVYINEAAWNQNASRVIDENPLAPSRFEVKYYFLEDDASDYVGMANRYQQYLIDELGVTPQTEANESKLYIEFLGGIKRIKNILGFPINTDIAITSFEDVANISNELNGAGITDLAVILTNWTDGTTDYTIPYKFKPESSLGGKSGFRNMLSSLNSIGVEIFPDVNLTDIRNNTWSYKAKRDVIQSLGNAPITMYPFSQSVYDPIKTYDAIYLLRPDKMTELAQKVIDKSSDYEFTGLSAYTLGQKMYSSFGKKAVGRTQSEQYYKEALQILSQNSKMLFSNPNAYVFLYASDITDIPLRSSQYLIESQDIPFYQIAMHGLINYSTESLNAYYDQDYYMLKAIETGSDLKYTLGAQNFEQLQFTEYQYYNYINYNDWKDTIIETYNKVSEVNSKVSDAKIIGHEYLTDDVVQTTYDNGISVVVNYSQSDYRSGNISVGASNYIVLGD